MSDIPKGWRLVPVEPTPETIKAIEFAIYRYSDCSARDAERGAPWVYRAMLSASAAPPVVGGDSAVARTPAAGET